MTTFGRCNVKELFDFCLIIVTRKKNHPWFYYYKCCWCPTART